MRILWIVTALVVALFGACTCQQRASVTPAEQGRVCSAGGATFNASSNECVCPVGQTWNGSACGIPPPQQPIVPPPSSAATPLEPPPAGEPVDVGRESATITSLAPQPAAKPEAAKPAPGPVDLAAVEKACRAARAEWIGGASFCACPAGRVLIGNRCRVLRGRMTDDVCRRAVHKGKWQQKTGECECQDGLVFSPNRGGCVPPVDRAGGDVALETLKRTCEATLNLGTWDPTAARCECPAGRVFLDERCQRKQTLTSRQVCESDSNRGTWSKDTKTCACPAGFVWFNQSCKAAESVDEKAACESELNGGKWFVAVKRCVCAKGKWSAKDRLCR